MAEQRPTFNFGPIDGQANPSINLAPLEPREIPPPESFQSFHELQQRSKDTLLRLLAMLQPGESYPGYVLMFIIQWMFDNLSDQEINKVLSDFLEKLSKYQDK